MVREHESDSELLLVILCYIGLIYMDLYGNAMIFLVKVIIVLPRKTYSVYAVLTVVTYTSLRFKLTINSKFESPNLQFPNL